MPLNKPVPDNFMRMRGKVHRFELTRTLRAPEKRMEYVKRSLANINRLESQSRK